MVQAKDVKRKELTKRYVHIPMKPKNMASGMAAQNLPMVAMFLKNKPLSWATLFLAVQSWLSDPLIKDPNDESQPAIFKIIFAFIAIATSYMDLIFPSVSPGFKRSVDKDAAKTIIDTVVDTATAVANAATTK